MSKKKALEEWSVVSLNDPTLVFTTYDLGCSAALVCAGFELVKLDKENPRKSLFVFRRTDSIDDAANCYWSGALSVSARAYNDTLKMLKNRLYSSEQNSSHY
jgi:hypothetical protein